MTILEKSKSDIPLRPYPLAGRVSLRLVPQSSTPHLSKPAPEGKISARYKRQATFYLASFPGPTRSPAEWSCTLLDFRTQNARPVYALRLIRRLDANSASVLISADDGNLYILKFSGSPKHPNALAHERIWTVLAGSVGLPVSPGEPISVPSSFFEENLSLSLFAPDGVQPQPGVHYGSRLLGDVSGSARPIEYLLKRDVGRVSNRADFLGMYIFDVWALCQKNRKAIFLKDLATGQFRAMFVGSGRVFEAVSADPVEAKTRARHRKPSLYAGLWKAAAVASWVERLKSAVPPALDSLMQTIPDDWHSGHLNTLYASSLVRLSELQRLVEAHSLAEESICTEGISDALPRRYGASVR